VKGKGGIGKVREGSNAVPIVIIKETKVCMPQIIINDTINGLRKLQSAFWSF